MANKQSKDCSIDRWSAGGVVLKHNNDGKLSVALCHRRSDSLWALPKGTPEEGESVGDTAVREVTEETGLRVELGPPIHDTYYSFFSTVDETQEKVSSSSARTIRINKTVHWYLMNCVGGDTSNHDHEYDDVSWVETNEASKRLTHKNETQVLEKAVAVHAGTARG